MEQFIKGMDISSYPEMMDKGFRYYDFDGKEVNLLLWYDVARGSSNKLEWTRQAYQCRN